MRMSFILPAVLALALSACGGGGSDSPATVQLTGVAATGAAVAGATVTAVNAAGTRASAITAADGSFTIDISDGAPFVLQVSDGAGNTLYSYAQAAGRANLTPLTTLALLQANAQKPLAALVEQWASTRLSAEQVLEAAKTVNANLAGLMQAQGVDPTRVNVFADAFAANRSGLDAVLDAMRVNISCSANACTQSITSPEGQVLLDWRGDIATTGITVSWSASTGGGTGGTGGGGSTGGSVTVGLGSCKAPVAGTWSMVVGTTVSGFGGISVPEVCVDGLPGAPASQAEFCGGELASQQLPPGVSILSCSYANNRGTITARISSPVVLDYTVTYTFVQR